MTAKELAQRYHMAQHVENGAFAERHYESKEPGRAASGSIYYYVSPGERTEFHRIDCDEYWCYIAGEPLEVWAVDENGAVSMQLLGRDEGCEPVLYLRKGMIFASRSRGTKDGTFLSCITVPRFETAGFELFSKEKMLRAYPQVKEFYE